MSREISPNEVRNIYIAERYRDVDTTLRLEFAALSGMIELVQNVARLDTDETPERIDEIMQQANMLCEKMTHTVKQVCSFFEQMSEDISAMEVISTSNDTVQIPEKVHIHIRSIKRFFDSDMMQGAIMGLHEMRNDVVHFAPMLEEVSALSDALTELERIIDTYLVRYPQSPV